MFTAAILKIPQTTVQNAATKKKMPQQNVAHDQKSVRHWLRQSVSHCVKNSLQLFNIWWLSQINPFINTATFINSFCPLNTRNLVSSASLSRKVQNEWCSCNNHIFVCNFAKCWPVFKIVPPANRMIKFEIKWSLNKPLYLKCAALLPVDYQ